MNPLTGTFSDSAKVAGTATAALRTMVKGLMTNPEFSQPLEEGQDSGEARANVMLAYRHLQDAEARLALAAEAMKVGV